MYGIRCYHQQKTTQHTNHQCVPIIIIKQLKSSKQKRSAKHRIEIELIEIELIENINIQYSFLTRNIVSMI